MAKEYLVGSTGFVGSNIALKHDFSGLFNSKNIADAYGGKPDLLVYAGIPAEMYRAAQNPEEDMAIIRQAIKNIEQIEPRRIILISTVAVYSSTKNVDEDTEIDATKLSAYGANRFALEKWVGKSFLNYSVIRLPALFGKNIKKNFLYDYIHFIPKLLTKDLYDNMVQKEKILGDFYKEDEAGFYRCQDISSQDESLLKKSFQKLNFSALNFTDSRSKYQFFNLKYLWDCIGIAIKENIRTLNLVTAPISISELYTSLTGEKFVNFSAKSPYDYDIKSKYSELFGGGNGYIQTKESVIADIKIFLRSQGAMVQ